MIENEKWRIRRLDSRNLVIETKSEVDPSHKFAKGDNTVRWDIYGYYGTVISLIKGLIDLEFMDEVERIGIIADSAKLEAILLRCTDEIIRKIKAVNYE